MTDLEYRSLIEFHAEQLTAVTKEPAAGYGVMKRDRVIEHAARLLELAQALEG